MGKPARIITFGLNNIRIWGTTQEEMLSLVMKKIDSVRGYKPDMICLPELFLEACGDNQNPRWEEISCEALEKLQSRAVELNCWIAASIYEKVPEHPQMRYITLYLIDRDGKIAAKYRKYSPSWKKPPMHAPRPAKRLTLLWIPTLAALRC